MSAKSAIQKKILTTLESIPKDRLKHYASFKDSQIKRFNDKEFITSLSEQELNEQYLAISRIAKNKYRDYYKISDKLLTPKGNPEYYKKIMAEINGESKENIFTAFKHVVFGK
ncbi:uncharacterized protein J8A68_005026 [[Candida] subhashii]|uniref:Cytochrome B pre-mRNA-processing protein 6 n=1 Tax=[Candida] subhashii TaxID=561895 RepID=A0A8J5QIM4_9ASCO|nr:uncharacterized protein J8A68_005026 [[Candida] subhashii]KAG7661448.1 hypothetical protein J8A68_005026 [[Candida] subhashii]